ncbi:hypothetical protein CH380_07890 [Leptospira adleri]|uniref:Uncharacterized protein n=1 Tax=Leptospira adleri TaxID=2023186 RepID=A0A2M9YQU6_9LEPT|nr:hypothetical protein CH380_07890 [Leptospira adleri]PJZ62004.1 hypothetical protein CH376_10095 [Leptospira adleri]
MDRPQTRVCFDLFFGENRPISKQPKSFESKNMFQNLRMWNSYVLGTIGNDPKIERVVLCRNVNKEFEFCREAFLSSRFRGGKNKYIKKKEYMKNTKF